MVNVIATNDLIRHHDRYRIRLSWEPCPRLLSRLRQPKTYYPSDDHKGSGKDDLNKMELAGIEPASPRCDRGVLPLYDSPEAGFHLFFMAK